MNRESEVNITGLILLFAGTVIAGCIISAVYLVILPVVLRLDTRFGIIAPALFGAGTGALSGLMIKFFKIQNAVQAGIIVAVGCLCFTWFKWSLFLANDYRDFIKTEGSDNYLALCEYADKNYADTLHKPYSDTAKKSIWEKDINKEIFGETPEEAVLVLNELFYHDSWYGYYTDIRDSGKEPSAVYYMARPGTVMRRIGQINYEGRWTFGKSDKTVSGVPYALAWIAEFLLICVPAVTVAVKKAQNLFILPTVHNAPAPYYNPASTEQTGVNPDAMGSVEYTPRYSPHDSLTSVETADFSEPDFSGIPEFPEQSDSADFAIPDSFPDDMNFSSDIPSDFSGDMPSDFSSDISGDFPADEQVPEPEPEKPAPQELEPFVRHDTEPEINFDNFDNFFK